MIRTTTIIETHLGHFPRRNQALIQFFILWMLLSNFSLEIFDLLLRIFICRARFNQLIVLFISQFCQFLNVTLT